ncbi:MAG TPA: hypothetical protein VGH19_17910 [Verrucomicrobiae bacterium]
MTPKPIHLAVLLLTLAASFVTAADAPLYVHLLAPEHLLTSRIHLGQPIMVRGKISLSLSGTIEQRGTNLIADLRGGTGLYGTSYQGEMALDKPYFSGGGGGSGGAGPLWFAVSTNADCTHIIEGLKKSQPAARSDRQVLLLNFPKSVDIADAQIEYFLTGPFGGVGNRVTSKPNLHQYVIDTTHESKPAQSLKAIIYCPGYGFALVNAPSLKTPAAGNATIDLSPQRTIPLAGKIVAPAGKSLAGLKLEVTYHALWGMEYFGYIDGMAPEFKVATADIAADGSFTLTLPDLANDATIKMFQLTEERLKLALRDPKTGNFPYALAVPESLGWKDEFKIASSYPIPLHLQARPK